MLTIVNNFILHQEQALLEFIFAASELVEAGWDIAAWMKEKIPSEHHPLFRTYHLRYRERIEALKIVLS